MQRSVLSRFPTGAKRVCVFKMADSSLDDIIKQKRMQRFGNGNQNYNNFQGNRTTGRPMLNRGRLFKDVQKDLGITARNQVSLTTDARNRIIQKQRIKYKDARDRLAQIAKQGDARDKLNLIRKTNPTQIRKINPMVRKAIPQQKAAVVKKKIINVPKHTLNAGQTRMKGTAVVRTVAGAGAVRPAFKKNTIMNVNPGMMKKPAFVTRPQRPGQVQRTGRPQFTVKNTVGARRRNNIGQVYNPAYGADVTDFRKDLQFVQRGQSFSGMGVPTAMETVLTTRQEPLIRTRPVETVVYDTEYEPEVRPSRLRITAANSNFRIGNQLDAQPQAWNPPTRIQPARDMYDDQVEYQVYPKKIATVSAARAPVDRGTKVVVSNLHPCVSIEDMEELFGTVGPILSVNMVRQGVAEALFVSQEDAYRSVDLFNNRQLDGQPMKVVVVRQKTPLVTTSSVQSRSVLKSARGRSGYYM